MTKLSEVATAMHKYNSSVAYGSECEAWGDFYNDTISTLGANPHDPYDADGEPVEVTEEFAEYWLKVAAGESPDYDAETGGHIG